MEKMSRLERLDKTIAHEKVDRVCTSTFSTCLMMAKTAGIEVKEMRWDPKLATKVGMDYMRTVGDDFYYNTEITAGIMKDLGVPVKEPDNNHCSPEEPFFKTPEDIESKDFSIDVMNPRETPWMNSGMFEKVALAREAWGDEFIIQPGVWGIFTEAGLLRGTENLMMDIMTEEGLVHKLLKKTEILVRDVQSRYCEAGAHTILNGEPSASEDLISADTFRKFIFEPTKSLVGHIKSNYQIHSYGLHICGHTPNTCVMSPEMGIDVYSFDSPIPLSHYKKMIGSRSALLGNVPTITVTMQGTVNDVMESSRSCIEQGAPGGGYILGGACDAPKESPIENLKAFVKAAEKYTATYQ